MNDDIADIATHLHVSVADLRTALGGGWHAASSADGNPTWVGHAGPTVALAIKGPAVVAGLACGEWTDHGTLTWSVGDPAIRVPLTTDEADLLHRLEEGIEYADEVGRYSLFTCFYCHQVLSPEFAFNANSCYACATGQPRSGH